MKGNATHERAEHEYRVRVKGLLRDDGDACAPAYSGLAAGFTGGGGDAVSGPSQIATPPESFYTPIDKTSSRLNLIRHREIGD